MSGVVCDECASGVKEALEEKQPLVPYCGAVTCRDAITRASSQGSGATPVEWLTRAEAEVLFPDKPGGDEK